MEEGACRTLRRRHDWHGWAVFVPANAAENTTCEVEGTSSWLAPSDSYKNFGNCLKLYQEATSGTFTILLKDSAKSDDNYPTFADFKATEINNPNVPLTIEGETDGLELQYFHFTLTKGTSLYANGGKSTTRAIGLVAGGNSVVNLNSTPAEGTAVANASAARPATGDPIPGVALTAHVSSDGISVPYGAAAVQRLLERGVPGADDAFAEWQLAYDPVSRAMLHPATSCPTGPVPSRARCPCWIASPC